MIERQKERYGWEFLFLGANIDAAKEAARFDIGADRAVNYKCDEAGTALNYEVISEAVNAASRRPAPQRRLEAPHRRGRAEKEGGKICTERFWVTSWAALRVRLQQQLQGWRFSAVQPPFRLHRRHGDDAGGGEGVAQHSRAKRCRHQKQHWCGDAATGPRLPDRGYGIHFGGWLYEDDPQPCQSYGNGSAMRVSSAAWLAVRHGGGVVWRHPPL